MHAHACEGHNPHSTTRSEGLDLLVRRCASILADWLRPVGPLVAQGLADFAAEEKSEILYDGIKEVPIPGGKFWLNKASATRAAAEVLATHKGLKGEALKKYMSTNFLLAEADGQVSRIYLS